MIADKRLASHLLANPAANPADAVKHMVSMQAQIYSGGLLSVGLRSKNATITDVTAAIKNAEIIRTWPMRGTLHFVHHTDVHWLLDLTGARVVRGAKSRMERHGLVTKDLLRVEKILRKYLEEHASISRPELYELLTKNRIDPTGGRGNYIAWYLSHHKVLCFGIPVGKQPSFVLLDDWVRPPKITLTREESIRELARRYFIAHGPATLQDFIWWSGLGIRECRQGLADAKEDLEHLQINEKDYWLAPITPSVYDDPVRLLPGFDEYLLGYTDRSDVMKEHHRKYVHPGMNGIFKSTIIRRGEVIGTWSQHMQHGSLIITPEWFQKPSQKVQEELDRARLAYLEFLEMKV